MEVFENLYRPRAGDSPLRGKDTLHEVINELEILTGQGKLENHEAFYSLPGRGKEMVASRKMRQAEAMEMLRRNRRWFSILAAWPDVEAIAVCNNLAMLNAGPESDVDLFVIVKPGKLWVTRFVLATLLALFGKRPRPGREHGTICLSFLVASDRLDLSSIALKDGDVYLSYWLSSLLPVYDPKNMISETKKQNQSLLVSSFANSSSAPISLWGAQTSGMKWVQILFSLKAAILSPFSGVLKNLQMRKFPLKIVNAAEQKNGNVVIDDGMLKFHTNDRRAYYRQEWEGRFLSSRPKQSGENSL
jgi:hypothetical protein